MEAGTRGCAVYRLRPCIPTRLGNPELPDQQRHDAQSQQSSSMTFAAWSRPWAGAAMAMPLEANCG
ncbi:MULTISPECIES: hypothetical protein [Halomonadaceae]|uniref:hypothetical protein n=1 Tax=Halomonadaceae TaxID=28256 RepID=UPI00159900AF|nr:MULTISPECIES: hypothetical protein [Halomonas]QJQ96175.1 hypothetical protein HIO72_13455 [Halomonas sp. PA5]